MNEVSIIINGVRYDAVEKNTNAHLCDGCDMYLDCILADSCERIEISYTSKILRRMFANKYKSVTLRHALRIFVCHNNFTIMF